MTSLEEKLGLAEALFGAGGGPSRVAWGGSSGGGVAWSAGEGITITGNVISAEVTQAELDEATKEIPVSWIEAL